MDKRYKTEKKPWPLAGCRLQYFDSRSSVREIIAAVSTLTRITDSESRLQPPFKLYHRRGRTNGFCNFFWFVWQHRKGLQYPIFLNPAHAVLCHRCRTKCRVSADNAISVLLGNPCSHEGTAYCVRDIYASSM